jgi:hypothetical protein
MFHRFVDRCASRRTDAVDCFARLDKSMDNLWRSLNYRYFICCFRDIAPFGDSVRRVVVERNGCSGSTTVCKLAAELLSADSRYDMHCNIDCCDVVKGCRPDGSSLVC